LLLTVPAVAVNVAVAAPEATVTDAGTVRSPLLLLMLTSAPPLGAPCESVTVQLEALLLLRLAGEQETETRVAEMLSDTLAVCDTPLYVAVTVAV